MLCRRWVITGKVVPCKRWPAKMGLDMLNLTTYAQIDQSYFEKYEEVREDKSGKRLYKYFVQTDLAQIMWKPHKFGPETNDKIPQTKVDINPKGFKSFNQLSQYLMGRFHPAEPMSLERFFISRIDLKADVEDLPIDVVLSRLHVQGYRRDSVSLIKGRTIYIGANPKIRIYDKTAEIKARKRKEDRKGKRRWKALLPEWDQAILESGKQITRFEIQARNYKGTLSYLLDHYDSLVSYFDRLKFYNFEDDSKIASIMPLQLLLSKIPRKARAQFDQFRDTELDRRIRENFTTTSRAWFEGSDEQDTDEVPF